MAAADADAADAADAAGLRGLGDGGRGGRRREALEDSEAVLRTELVGAAVGSPMALRASFPPPPPTPSPPSLSPKRFRRNERIEL